MNKTVAAQTISVIALEELAIEQREHAAYGECYQFEGDECGTCIELFDEMELMDLALAAIREYNTAYAEYVTGRAALYVRMGQGARINEADLVNAHVWAGRGDLSSIPPMDGWVQAKPVARDGECGRCGGDSMVGSFPHVYGGQCFECGITAAQAAARARRTAKSEEERTDARGVLDVVSPN